MNWKALIAAGVMIFLSGILHAQKQVGPDIDGEAAGDLSGYAVSLSADSSRVAVGAALNDGTGLNAGHLCVYQWSGTTWTQFGVDIDGEAGGDQSGIVSMSADGNLLASGAIYNDGNGIDSGHVRVFAFPTLQNQMALNDLFYDSANSGHGFDINVHESGVTMFYYGHTSGGERLWLISGVQTADFEFDVPYELEMYEVTDGIFGKPVEPASYWGTITITLADCDSGHASFSGVDGNIDMGLERIVGLAGMDCGSAP